MMGDDFGTQKGLFVSPDMWRRFLRPGFKAFIELGREYGCKIAHHSCGSIKPIIPRYDVHQGEHSDWLNQKWTEMVTE